MSYSDSNSFSLVVQSVGGSRNFSLAYDFPTSDADGTARFPKTFKPTYALAWHSAFIYGNHILEWGDDNHSVYGWNSIRLRSMQAPYTDNYQPIMTDWLYPGDNYTPPTPSNYNATKVISHYNNHVEILHPTENWWFKFFNGGRYQLSGTTATMTHRTKHQTNGDTNPITYDYNYWDGPNGGDWIRDDTGSGWWGDDATNAIYNPMYDYNATHDCWLLIGGAPGSDTAYDGCWIIERNPNYPATQPEPWRIRNFAVTGKAEANYVPRYQARNLGRFRGDWLYIFGGRESQGPSVANTPSAGITETTNHWSNKAHRINVVTGQMEALPNMPVCMVDGVVMYDELYDVFIITGKPWQSYPVKLRTGAMTEAAKVGFTEDPYYPGVWVNQSDFTSYSVMIFDPQDNTYTDATPAGYVAPLHALGGYKKDGHFYVRAGSDTYPPSAATTNSWRLSYYYRLSVTEV